MITNKTRTPIFEMEHGEPPKTTVQPQSTWLWLSQLIRRVDELIAFFQEGHRGLRVAGV
jgi:hypothetical protein